MSGHCLSGLSSVRIPGPPHPHNLPPPPLPLPLPHTTQLNTAWKKFESGIMRRLVLKEGIRMDGRKVTDIRPIWSRAGMLPRTHGSALFTRGETQVTESGRDRECGRERQHRAHHPLPAASGVCISYLSARYRSAGCDQQGCTMCVSFEKGVCALCGLWLDEEGSSHYTAASNSRKGSHSRTV